MNAIHYIVVTYVIKSVLFKATSMSDYTFVISIIISITVSYYGHDRH
jgi:hypothetical protein